MALFYVSSIAFDLSLLKYFIKNIASRMSQSSVVLESEIWQSISNSLYVNVFMF